MTEIYTPTHYTKSDIEVIEIIEQITKDYPPEIGYHIGNVIKYLARSPHKGDMESDLNKALNYMHRAVRGEWYEIE